MRCHQLVVILLLATAPRGTIAQEAEDQPVCTSQGGTTQLELQTAAFRLLSGASMRTWRRQAYPSYLPPYDWEHFAPYVKVRGERSITNTCASLCLSLARSISNAPLSPLRPSSHEGDREFVGAARGIRCEEEPTVPRKHPQAEHGGEGSWN